MDILIGILLGVIIWMLMGGIAQIITSRYVHGYYLKEPEGYIMGPLALVISLMLWSKCTISSWKLRRKKDLESRWDK